MTGLVKTKWDTIWVFAVMDVFGLWDIYFFLVTCLWFDRHNILFSQAFHGIDEYNSSWNISCVLFGMGVFRSIHVEIYFIYILGGDFDDTRWDALTVLAVLEWDGSTQAEIHFVFKLQVQYKFRFIKSSQAEVMFHHRFKNTCREVFWDHCVKMGVWST